MNNFLLNEFKDTLLKEGMVNRSMVTSLEESIGEVFISDKVNMNNLSVSMSPLGVQDILNIVDQKLLEDTSISNEDSLVGEDINRSTNDPIDINNNTLHSLRELQGLYRGIQKPLQRLTDSAIFVSIGENLLAKEKEGKFIKIGSLEPIDLVEDLDLLTSACKDRVSEEYDDVYLFLNKFTKEFLSKVNNDKAKTNIYTSYHSLLELVNLGCIKLPEGTGYDTFHHEEISNNTNLLYLFYILRMLASLDIEKLEKTIIKIAFTTTDRDVLVKHLSLTMRLVNIYEELNQFIIKK